MLSDRINRMSRIIGACSKPILLILSNGLELQEEEVGLMG